MSLSTRIEALRRKPRRVRERYALVCVVVAAPILFAIWFLTFRFDSRTSGAAFFKGIGNSVSKSFSSPVYSDTFGEGKLGGNPPSVLVPETEKKTQTPTAPSTTQTQ